MHPSERPAMTCIAEDGRMGQKAKDEAAWHGRCHIFPVDVHNRPPTTKVRSAMWKRIADWLAARHQVRTDPQVWMAGNEHAGARDGERSAGGAPRILIVDGDAHLLDAMPALMRRSWLKGWMVELASSREEALELLAGKAFDLVCVNLYLPPTELHTCRERVEQTLAGREVPERIYENGVRTVGEIAATIGKPPVIAWSYYALLGHVEAARSAGACEVVECRYEAEPLRKAIEKVSRRARQRVKWAA